MTAPTLPYFFHEADIASFTREPGAREKTLGFTTADLKWLKRVYLPTHTTRVDDAHPMQVHRLILTPPRKRAIPLAGAFLMSRPAGGEVTLYTPYNGLTKHADLEDLNSKLMEWLSNAPSKDELLRYLSIEQRHVLQARSEPIISTELVEGSVFQDQETVIALNQSRNIRTMLAELIKTPTLQSMLDETLTIALNKRFPALDQRHTRMDSLVSTAVPVTVDSRGVNRHTVSSLSLSDAVLHFYLTNTWPEGEFRSFSNPAHGVSSNDDNQAWEATLKEVAQSLTPRLQSLLDTFWNSPMSTADSRADFFAQSLRDTYCVDLLLKHQQRIFTTEEHQQLMAVCRAGTTVPLAASPSIQVEKLRVTALYKHYVELASTLMISVPDVPQTHAFLYSPSRGIESSTDLSQIQNIVLRMMKTEGHEDNLLNFLALEERATFLSLDPKERKIVGVPISGPVFQDLMTEILAKQAQNLQFALSRYREAQGTVALDALLDNALDVRTLIDQRLLRADADGRWSTRADQRWNNQPATVRAESAKQLLAQLSSIGASLDLEFENNLVLPQQPTRFEDVQTVIAPFLSLLTPKLAHTLSVALRSEVKLRTLNRTLSAVDQTIITTVLDSPVRLQRWVLNGFLPDVFSLAVKAGTASTLLHLANCFMLTERGGLDPHHSGQAILWTPAFGFEAFGSLTPLKAELQRRLLDPDEHWGLLENLGRYERTADQTFTLAPLQLVHENFLDHLQKPYALLDRISIEQALASKLPENTLKKLLDLIAASVPITGLSRGMGIAQSLITQQKLPAWLAKASIGDQVLHAELLQQYLANADDDKDYLSGQTSLTHTAHAELQKRLKTAFRQHDVDPDNVELQFSPHLTATGLTQTLTTFALTHFDELNVLPIKKITSLTEAALPAGMNADYVKKLVRNLKLGELQQSVLETAFASSNANAASYRTLFAKQLPWQLLHYAHSEKLQERLSERGFNLIAQIMNMPDTIARAALTGANALIRPLELVATHGAQAAKALGVYLIGPGPGKDGPHVLLAPYSSTHGIKEYESESSLLAELNTTGALQDWVLKCLSTPVRATYKNLWASTINASSDIKLASNPITGNLFSQLFDDNTNVLTRLLGTQSDSDAKSEWQTIKHVFGEGLEQAATFLSGKLAYPITVWNSYRDIKASAEDLQEHKWGSALKAFISGIAQLAMLRQSMEAPPTTAVAEPEPSLEVSTTKRQWQDIDITAAERTRLQRHESIDINLQSLTPASASGLYIHPTTKKYYAPVEGKVYRVEKRGTPWRIVSDRGVGPHLLQNTSKQWILDPPALAPRYGMLRRLKTRTTRQAAMNVEATGMHAIRQLNPVRARLIDEALDLATTYAWNSHRNLQLIKTSAVQTTRVHQLIKDFLGVPAVLPDHVTQLEKIIGEVFGALLDPDLRTVDSERFVTGTSRDDPESVFAFTIPNDARKKLYLLEKFFLPRFDHYRNYMPDPAFAISAHARAVTLIHELSHLVSNTEDIAYMDSSKPFVDLLGTFSPRAQLLKRQLGELQQEALSSRSPLNQLFKIFNPGSGDWEDLGSTTYENTAEALKHVLTLTGQQTLQAARSTFMNDSNARLAVQLGNADSVAWLISHLGRQLDISTP
ncbi:dermonecrotic toxin domain-containing protein [Pseudomonas sp. NPDC087697]|uniref:dermonecrotic toxin domain-containing protein n=1 Tax=Pseudomonas sp. NPDC087697 TaxID=3364447 RepID=UPI00381D200A